MRTLLRLWPLLSTAVVCAAAGQSDLERVRPVPADQPIPLSDFFRPELMKAPVMNLAGTHIAAPILANQDQYALMVEDLNTKKLETAGALPDCDVHSVWWMGDDRVLYTFAARKLGDIDILAAAVGKVDRPYPVIQGYSKIVVCVPYASPTQPLVWMQGGNETGHDEGVSVVDASLNSGRLVDLLSLTVSGTDYSDVKDINIRHSLQNFPAPAGGVTERYICDVDDALAFAINSKNGVETLYRRVDRSWERCPVDLDEVVIVDAGNKPGELLVLGPRQAGKPRALQFMDAATGKLGDVVLQDPQYDFNGVVYRDRATPHKILGLRFQRNAPVTVWFDPNMRAVQGLLDAQYKGQIVQIVDWNRAMTRFVVGHYTDRQPIAYDWVDLEKKAAGPINESRPWLAASRMHPTVIFQYKTKDGRKLDAYLTLPAGASQQHPVPMVVIPPSDPTTDRAVGGFDATAQFLASRGYAVLKPNLRGSPGYSWAFPHEDEWDYLKMNDDVSAATHTAIRTKLIDPRHVAIVGTQFGGYLAAQGVSTEPGLYCCAVTIDGTYDWAALVAQSKYNENDSPYHGWLVRRLGDPNENKAKYDALSPLRHADQIKVPMLVAFGRGSSPVEIGQPHDLLSALERNHVPHEDMIVNDERHGILYLDKQLELWQRIDAFLARNLSGAR